MKRLAIITTHPIQYYAPIFRLLSERSKIEIKVYYTLGQTDANKFDPGFSRQVSWDIPLLEGYTYEWVNNTSNRPDTRHFKGIVTPTLIERITAWQADAVLIFGWAYHGHLKAIRHFNNMIPVYFRGDSTLINSPTGFKSLIKTMFLKYVYRKISHAIYVGKNNKAYFLKYGLKEHQLSFAPHAIDNSRFEQVRSSEVTELRNSLKINSDEILILYAGKFEDVKDLEILIAGFVALGMENVHLLLVGNGVEETKLKEHVKNNCFGNKIHFMGFQNQSYMPVLYQACDLFCLPSKSETWGLCINEAMACGKAVIVSDRVGCAPDLIEEGKNGYIFSQGDATSLTKAFKQILLNKDTLNKFGSKSRQIIQNWTFIHIAKAIERTLLNELNQN